jgi:hypothetical protein
MNTLLDVTDVQHTGAAVRKRDTSLFIALEVVDPEVVAELEKYPDGSPREKYALGALRLGALAIRQASGELDAVAVREASQELLAGLGELLATRGTALTADLSGALRQYFDPTTGALPQRIEALLKNDGDLDRALRNHLAPENSTLARALATHLGDGSAIFKLLSPTDSNGLKAQIERMLESVLTEQQEQILHQFSLDKKDSALSRLIRELTANNGTLTTDLKLQVDSLVGEFSLDKPDSALSRLVAKVETAQRAMSDEFSTDNAQSAFSRLSRMLIDTRQQIDKNLTLDDETSALSRLKRELLSTIDGLVRSNGDFQTEVRTTLASLQARKEEAARSTQHGHAFEDQLGLVIAAEAQRLNDPYVPTGCTAGAIKNCKTGDFVSILGPDSAAPNARVVWEAKEDKSYDLRRALSEIEEARKNRQAQVGVFVFSRNTAPDTLQSFARYGSDLVIVWDAEDPDSDLFVKAAFSVARALVTRESHESLETEHVVKSIDLATRCVEKQLEHLDQIKTWAETIKNNGEKIADRACRMRSDLAKEVEHLDRQILELNTNGVKA